MSVRAYDTLDGFQYDTEPDYGINLTTGEQWSGWRVKYRLEGARRWIKFIIVDATSDTDVLAAIKTHARRKARKV